MVKDSSAPQGSDPAALPGFLSGKSGVPDAGSSGSEGDAGSVTGAVAGPFGALAEAAAKVAAHATRAAMSASVADRPVEENAPRTVQYKGRIWDVVSETFTMPGQDTALTRDFIEHPGAVGILALDDQGRVLLQRQRRQPVHAELWEIPAGLLDMEGESAVAAAQRELFEEADLRAQRWDVLVDQYNSPGSSSEAIRVFLARDLTQVPEGERFERGEEEADMPYVWLPLPDAVAAVLSGRVGNPTTVSGVLALAAHEGSDFVHLRPADAAWPARPEAGGRL